MFLRTMTFSYISALWVSRLRDSLYIKHSHLLAISSSKPLSSVSNVKNLCEFLTFLGKKKLWPALLCSQSVQLPSF